MTSGRSQQTPAHAGLFRPPMVPANQDAEVLGGATNVRLDTKERQQEGRAQDHGGWAEVHWISHESLDISTRRSLDFV